MIAKECIWPVIIDEFPPGRTCRTIVQENDAGFACSQQIERKFHRTKFLWPVDENSIAMFKAPRQNIARIAKQTFDVAMRRKPAECNCVVGRSNLELNAYDPHIRKAVRQRQRAATERPPRLDNLARFERTHHTVKKKHLAKKNSTTALPLGNAFDCSLKIRPVLVSRRKNGVDAEREIRLAQT